MKKRSILLVIVSFISIIILSVNSNNKYLVKEESLATYIDGKKTDSFPAKGTVAFSKADCDNNTNIEWDNDTWGLYVTNLSNKVKCNIYFKIGENAVTKITNLASSDTTNMASDDQDNNIRYIGANPNNYVYFNCSDYSNQTSDTCEKWRIIGVFNNIEKEDRTKESLIKIIRDDNIGEFSWDYKSDKTYLNDWSTSALQKLLNTGAYYNGTEGIYYNNNAIASNVDFKKNGLKNDKTRNSIQDVLWNLGATDSYEDVNSKKFYDLERRNNVYESRPVTWNGKIGLMYPSDYGYATSGGVSVSRAECINKPIFQYSSDENSDCLNDYLYKSSYHQWTLTPYLNNNSSLNIDSAGYIRYNWTAWSYGIRPALFLKSNILITSGDGSSNTPYQLGL